MSKTILVVDDEEEILEMLKLRLTKDLFTVMTAGTGEEAIEILSKEKVDLVLLDILLPRVDGIEVCKRIKENPKTARIPVIFLTAFAVPEVNKKAHNVHAELFVSKPYEYRNLKQEIDRLIQ